MTGTKSKSNPKMSMDSMGPSSLGPGPGSPWIVVTPDGFSKLFPGEAEALAAADLIPGALAAEAEPADATVYHSFALEGAAAEG